MGGPVWGTAQDLCPQLGTLGLVGAAVLPAFLASPLSAALGRASPPPTAAPLTERSAAWVAERAFDPEAATEAVAALLTLRWCLGMLAVALCCCRLVAAEGLRGAAAGCTCCARPPEGVAFRQGAVKPVLA